MCIECKLDVTECQLIELTRFHDVRRRSTTFDGWSPACFVMSVLSHLGSRLIRVDYCCVESRVDGSMVTCDVTCLQTPSPESSLVVSLSRCLLPKLETEAFAAARFHLLLFSQSFNQLCTDLSTVNVSDRIPEMTFHVLSLIISYHPSHLRDIFHMSEMQWL